MTCGRVLRHAKGGKEHVLSDPITRSIQKRQIYGQEVDEQLPGTWRWEEIGSDSKGYGASFWGGKDVPELEQDNGCTTL